MINVPGTLRLWPWLAAVLSGILLTLCFPRWDQGWLCWVALTPLIAAVWFGGSSPQPAAGENPAPSSLKLRFLRLAKLPVSRPFLLGGLTGVVFFWTVFSWLTNVTVVGWFLLSCVLAGYVAVWAGFLDLARRLGGDFTRSGPNLVLALSGAAAWTALEWVRSWLFFGFGWNGLGVALHGNLPFVQITEYTGVAGLSFLVAFTNLTAVITVRRFVAEAGQRRIRPHWDFSANMALIAAVFFFGVRTLFQPQPAPDTSLRVAAVQANIPQEQKFDRAFSIKIFERYNALSDAALAMSPQLLLWPEAATPGALFGDQASFDFVHAVALRSENFLLGSLDFDEEHHDYNIAALFTNKGENLQTYRKIHLVPFGEFIPFRHSFPLFAWIVGDEVPGDFTPGKDYKVLELQKPDLRIATLICFEDTVGDLTRRFVQRGAQALINVTNDGWFKHSPGAEQHLAHSIFRAVENRRPLLRAANTGVTAFIDPLGRITHSLRGADGSPFVEGILFGEVKIPAAGAPLTFYTRHGEVFVKTCVALTFAMALLLAWRRKS